MRLGIVPGITILSGATHAETITAIDIVEDVPAPRPYIASVKKIAQGPTHHFFGYYGIVPWYSTGENLVCMESNFGDRMVEARIVLNNLNDGSRQVYVVELNYPE